jgi:hypothetical protein
LVNTKTGQRKSIVVKLVIVATGGSRTPQPDRQAMGTGLQRV